MSIRFLGASHANALRHAFEFEYARHPFEIRFGGAAAVKNFYKPFHTFDGHKITFINKDIADGFKLLFGVDCITAADQVWGVIAGFTSVRIWGSWFWRDGYSISDAENLKKFHISKSLICHMNKQLNGAWFQFLLDLRQLDLRVILVAAPPPMRIHPSFENGVDPEVAVLVSRLVADHWREFCEQHQIEAVEVPEHVLDKDGFLLPEYVVDDGKEDWTHGNLVYGKEMVIEVLKKFDA